MALASPIAAPELPLLFNESMYSCFQLSGASGLPSMAIFAFAAACANLPCSYSF